MLVEQLKSGLQVSKEELRYVKFVTADIRNCGYGGQINVVGSREGGSRISTKTFYANCQDLSQDEYEWWRKELDRIAREKDISAGEISRVKAYLPKDTPKDVLKIFTTSGHIDSDLDLTIEKPNEKVKANYYDEKWPKGSGLVVEIYEPGDTSYLKESVFNF